MKGYKEIILQVGDIYKWLDDQRIGRGPTAGVCEVCGKCCDFKTYGHRLYVATPEMVYFADKLGSRDFRQMTTGRCPYQFDGKCTVYPYRFAGCRIFCCKGEAGFQSDLTEAAVKKFRAICEKFQIPYRYIELVEALKDVLVNIGQSADIPSAGGRAD